MPRRTMVGVGDRVQTTREWNFKYWTKGVRGTVLRIAVRGPNPQHPERNHYVDLDDEYMHRTKRLWFDPKHLELEG